jgi:hypothetical protein
MDSEYNSDADQANNAVRANTLLEEKLRALTSQQVIDIYIFV